MNNTADYSVFAFARRIWQLAVHILWLHFHIAGAVMATSAIIYSLHDHSCFPIEYVVIAFAAVFECYFIKKIFAHIRDFRALTAVPLFGARSE